MTITTFFTRVKKEYHTQNKAAKELGYDYELWIFNKRRID